MNIGGLQKMTLLDYPGKIACTVFLSGCNLRCPFCHNASLVLPRRLSPVMTQEELLVFLRSRVRRLDGVCITGGEPTLYHDLPELIEEIRELGFSVKLDTNGSSPEMLQNVLPLVDYVAMDIKNCPEKYCDTCGGVDILAQVRESVRLLMDSGVDYEFRTTVCHPFHRPEDLKKIGQWLSGAKQYFIQQFVDSGDLVGEAFPLSPEEMQALWEAVLPDIPNAKVRGI